MPLTWIRFAIAISTGWMLAVPAAWASPGDGKFEYVVFDEALRWPGKVMQWYYNPTGQPASISEAEAIGALQRAAAAWRNGCQVELKYMGKTSAKTYVEDGINVVGWQGGFSASGETGINWGGRMLTEADIRLNIGDITDVNTLEGIAVHEFGHALGLDHSDQPDSVMFANPYHPVDFQLAPRIDDLNACVALYGSSGAATATPAASPRVQLASGESAAIFLSTSKVTAAPPSSLQKVGATVPKLYFYVFYEGLKKGSAFKVEWVAPDGTPWKSESSASVYQGGYFWYELSWGNYSASVLPGLWQVRFYQDGQLKAERGFEQLSDYAVPAVPDVAIIGQASAGRYAFKAINMASEQNVAQYQWSFDDGAAVSGADQTVLLAPGVAHTVRLMAWNASSRYNGQDNGPNSVVTQAFSLNGSGLFSSFSFSGQASGTKRSLTLQADAVIPEPGAQSLYILARVGGSWYYKSPSGWGLWQGGAAPAPLLTVTAPAMVTLKVLNGVDVSGLPTGTEVYAGYGGSFDGMVAAARYGRIFTMQ